MDLRPGTRAWQYIEAVHANRDAAVKKREKLAEVCRQQAEEIESLKRDLRVKEFSADLWSSTFFGTYPKKREALLAIQSRAEVAEKRCAEIESKNAGLEGEVEVYIESLRENKKAFLRKEEALTSLQKKHDELEKHHAELVEENEYLRDVYEKVKQAVEA